MDGSSQYRVHNSRGPALYVTTNEVLYVTVGISEK